MSATIPTENQVVVYEIKPQDLVPSIDAADWPLLLKDYDKREFCLKYSHRNP